MKNLFFIILTVFLGTVAFGQEADDRGYLASLLENALSGAGRAVQIEGFEGALSSKAKIARITIADDAGIWITLSDVLLDWNRAALLRGRLEINELSAQTIDLPRLPNSEASINAEARGFSLPTLPVSVNITTAEISELSLGQTVLGEPAVLKLNLTAQLIDGAGQAQISAERIDEKSGAFSIRGVYAPEGPNIELDISLEEGQGGIAARLLNLPGSPSVSMKINGSGPLDDFETTVALSTDGEERVGGTVTILAGTDQARRFRADLGGDVTALFDQKYQKFFGNDLALIVTGTRALDGSLEIEEMKLRTQEMELAGRVSLNSDSWPTFLDVDGRIASPDGEMVLLPVSGKEALVQSARLSLKYDQANGDNWQGGLWLEDFRRSRAQIDNIAIDAKGDLKGDVGLIGQINAIVTAQVTGLHPTEPDLAVAFGQTMALNAQIAFVENQPLRLSALSVVGDTYSLTGDAVVDALETGFSTKLNARATASDLTRFAAISGQPLSGAVELGVAGTFSALAGTFDLDISGTGTDLKLGQAQVDRLLHGETRLNIAAERSTDGLTVRSAVLKNAEIDLIGSGRLAENESEIRFDAQLRETELVLPGFVGPLKTQGTAQQDLDGWILDVKVDGPYGINGNVSGRVTGPAAAVSFQANMPDVRRYVPEIGGPLMVAGTAAKSPQGWRIDTNVTGPSGTSATVAGTVANDSDHDIAINGFVPLALVGPYIKPQNVQGVAQFNLRMRGLPSLSSLSGLVETTGARLVAPDLRLALADLNVRVALDQGRAYLNLQSKVSSGGRLAGQGSIAFSQGFPANLSFDLAKIAFVDPGLYKSQVSGSLAVDGPLRGGAVISGVLNIDEAEIIVPSSTVTRHGSIPQIKHFGEPLGVNQSRARAGLLNIGATNANAGSGATYPLNIVVNAPGRIFVRGRGVDAELGGSLRLLGTTRDTVTSGSLQLARGRIDILEQRFTLDEGTIQLQGNFDPFIRLVATTQTDTGSASISVEGPVSAPEVSFGSVPEAPEEEVLSQLFFGREITKLSAFQALQLATAVATLAGRGGNGVVSKLRKRFDLDNLDVISDSNGNASLRVGKYISENVYTDVTAGTQGVGEVSLNLDLSPSLKAKGTLGSDGNSSVGLFFEKDY